MSLEGRIHNLEAKIAEKEEQIKNVAVGSEPWKILMDDLKEDKKSLNLLLEQSKPPQGTVHFLLSLCCFDCIVPFCSSSFVFLWNHLLISTIGNERMVELS